MTALAPLLRMVAVGMMFVLAAAVAMGLLSGSINTRGLLSTKTPHGLGTVSPSRVQLLLISLASAVHYVQLVIQSPDTTTLPVPPAAWLTAFGASNAVYVLGKAGIWLTDLYRNQRRS